MATVLVGLTPCFCLVHDNFLCDTFIASIGLFLSELFDLINNVLVTAYGCKCFDAMGKLCAGVLWHFY